MRLLLPLLLVPTSVPSPFFPPTQSLVHHHASSFRSSSTTPSNSQQNNRLPVCRARASPSLPTDPSTLSVPTRPSCSSLQSANLGTCFACVSCCLPPLRRTPPSPLSSWAPPPPCLSNRDAQPQSTLPARARRRDYRTFNEPASRPADAFCSRLRTGTPAFDCRSQARQRTPPRGKAPR